MVGRVKKKHSFFINPDLMRFSGCQSHLSFFLLLHHLDKKEKYGCFERVIKHRIFGALVPFKCFSKAYSIFLVVDF